MCGRFALTTPGDILARLFQLPSVPDVEPRYNVAPTQMILVVRQRGESKGKGKGKGKDGAKAGSAGERSADYLHWGLIPFWADDPSIASRMINARAESAAEKPAYRHAFRKRRCIVPASGFYEWQKVGADVKGKGKGAGSRGGTRGGVKQPFYVHREDGQPLALAGLWERWRPKDEPDAEPIDSVTILTMQPTDQLAELHNRMPVILHPDAIDTWLSGGDATTAEGQTEDEALLNALEAVISHRGAEGLAMRPVSRRVNNVRNDDARILEGGDEDDDGGHGETKGETPSLFD
jgi:putative SOS response-associated peptidase YedK